MTGVKSETIKYYENKVEMLNGHINELERHNLNLQTEIETMKNEI